MCDSGLFKMEVGLPSLADLAATFSQQFTNMPKEEEERLKKCMKNATLQDLEIKKRAIGKGSFGAIDVVQLKNNDRKDIFALKRMKKSLFTTTGAQQQALTEKRILMSVNCKFIIKYYRSFQDLRNIYILMEFCPGGELWTKCPVDQRAAVFYTACVVEALCYLHQRNIIHRDLKTENLVLDNKGYVKLIDFGLAHRLTKDNTKIASVCGTVNYYAPEMVNLLLDKEAPHYDQSVDLWSLGQVVYFLLTGYPAFDVSEEDQLYEDILGGMRHPNFVWCSRVSDYARNFILQLCELNPAKRLGCMQRGGFGVLRRHPWFREMRWGLLRKSAFPPPEIPGPFSFAKYLGKDLGPNESKASELVDTPAIEDTQWANEF